MPRTKQECIDQFKHKLAGISLFGASDPQSGTASRMNRVFDIPELVVTFLGEIYDYVARGDLKDIELRIAAEAKAEQLEKELTAWRKAMTIEDLQKLGSKIQAAAPQQRPSHNPPQGPNGPAAAGSPIQRR